jgi:hypothetical protein
MKRRVRERIARGDGLTVLDLLEAFVFRGWARFVQDEPAILVERFFNKIKHCRRVATRYDKFAANYLAFVQLASIRLWLRVNESTLAMTSLAFCLRQASSARASSGRSALLAALNLNKLPDQIPTQIPLKHVAVFHHDLPAASLRNLASAAVVGIGNCCARRCVAGGLFLTKICRFRKSL